MPDTNPVLTEADNGKTITVPADRPFAVELRENASGGYRWSLDPPDNGDLRVVDIIHAPAPASIGGSSGVRWVMQSRKPGLAWLRFKLWRPFEGESSVQREFAVTVEIR